MFPAVTTQNVPLWRTCPHCYTDLKDDISCHYRVNRYTKQRYLHSISYKSRVSVNDGGSVMCNICKKYWHSCHLDPDKRNQSMVQQCKWNCWKNRREKNDNNIDIYTEEKVWRYSYKTSCDSNDIPKDAKEYNNWLKYKLGPTFFVGDGLNVYIIPSLVPEEQVRNIDKFKPIIDGKRISFLTKYDVSSPKYLNDAEKQKLVHYISYVEDVQRHYVDIVE